jgi:hypothetical protein
MRRPIKTKKEKKSKLETEYKKYFYSFNRMKEMQTSLAQPDARKVVNSVATYAVYEEPI